MKTALAVLIFALLPQSPSQGTKSIQQQTNSGKKVSSSPTAVPELPTSQSTPNKQGTREANADEDEPVRVAQPIAITSRPDYAAWVFSFFLVVVGALQVWLLCRTMAFVRTQAHEAKRQRVTMGHQLTVMKGQLANMGESLRVTQDSVAFAKKNLDVFINEKRGRIFVELKPLELDVVYTFGTRYAVKYTATFHGQTFAFIEESRAEAKVTDSPEPPELRSFILGGINLPKAIPPDTEPKEGVLVIWDDIDAVVKSFISHGKSFVHCRGIIKYKDFVGEERETAFCCTWKPRAAPPGIGGGYWEKTGPPEANRET